MQSVLFNNPDVDMAVMQRNAYLRLIKIKKKKIKRKRKITNIKTILNTNYGTLVIQLIPPKNSET